MVAYPVELPLDAVTVLLGYVRSNAPATNAAVHAAWNLAGYGMGKGLPTVQAYGDGDDLIDDETALMSLFVFLDGPTIANGAPQGILLSVAIGVAIKIAMRILKEIIA